MRRSLRELADVHYGASPNSVRTDDSPFPIFGSGGLVGCASRPLFDGPLVVVARKGTLGKPTYCRSSCWVIDTAYAVIAKNGFDTKWLYYNLANFNLESLNEATGVPSISRDFLCRVAFETQPPKEQGKIARILTTLDSLIEKTEALIAKYEAIKQGMMHDLFTRGVDAHGHLRPTQAEAPDPYKQSELGWIPKEWETCRVDVVGSVQLGRQRSPKHQSGRFTTPYLRVANVFDGYIDYSDVLEMDFTPSERENYSLQPGDVLLNEGQSLELVGRSAMYTGEPGRFCFQNTLIRFRAYQSNSPAFFRGIFKHCLDCGRFMAIARQTTSVAHLGADRLAKMLVPCPTPDEQHRIAARLAQHEAACGFHNDQCNKLLLLKSGLMQDLLTGRVRVKVDEAQEVPADG